MTKQQASRVKLLDKVRCHSLGIAKVYTVDAIVNEGPRKPYFLLGEKLRSYRDVTHANYRMLNSNCSGANGRPESRADLKRERDRVYSDKRRKGNHAET